MVLLGTKQLAEKFGCSTRQICRLVKEQSLPCYRWGKKFRFCEAEVDKWLADRRIQPNIDASIVDDILRDLNEHNN